MNREIKKQQLKKRMISTTEATENVEYSEEMEEELRNHSIKLKKRRNKIILFVLLIGLLSALGFRQYQSYYQYTEYSVVWEKPLDYSIGSFVQYINFGSNVLKYSKDGVSYIDYLGRVIWMQSYEMKTPIVAVKGEFVAIADQAGNQIYIFNKDGMQGVATTLLPIMKVSISETGLVAAILEDAKADYIMLYKKDGTPLDISIKGLLDGDIGIGYPLDLALSPDGTQMLGNFIYLSSGSLKNRAAFYNFSEAGKSNKNRFVGGFHQIYDTSLIAQVMFFTDVYSCTVADNRLVFYSTQNVMSPEVIANIPVDEEIRSVFYSDKYVGIIVNTVVGEYPNRLDVYSKSGKKIMSKDFHYAYSNAEFDGNNIFMYNDSSCRIYNLDGTLKFDYTFDFNLVKIKNGSMWNRFFVIGPQTMQEIKLQ